MTHLLCEGIKMRKDIDDGGHSAVLCTLPRFARSLNKRVFASLRPNPLTRTSDTSNTLSEIRLGGFKKRCKNERK